MKTTIPSHLSDDALASELMRLVRRHRDTTAHLVAHLAEFDTRRLYLAAGFSSLFTYCREVLQLSESESYNRIEAARGARRFPVILDMLGEGSVHLTTVRLLARHLTDGNHRELLAAACRKSKLEVEELVARHFPRPEVPSSIRKLPEARPIPPLAATVATVTCTTALAAAPGNEAGHVSAPVPRAAVPPPSASDRPVITPVAADRYEIRFTASASTCEKLRLAKDLLRHAVPTGDTAEIIDRALSALLEDLARKKFAATRRPRPSRGTAAGSRHVPAKVQRAVWLRDGGRCAFVSKAGRRCNERGFLEFHHLEPFAVGGKATVGNIQLRCRAHNTYEADLFYGPGRRGEGVIRESSPPYGSPWSRQLVLERVAHRRRGRRPAERSRPYPHTGKHRTHFYGFYASRTRASRRKTEGSETWRRRRRRRGAGRPAGRGSSARCAEDSHPSILTLAPQRG